MIIMAGASRFDFLRIIPLPVMRFPLGFQAPTASN